ncbi:hypothetical protein [Beijerinckia sp. L45]|uniref:hypothetical protein n=1 Tax=Beijerinckia sp. L45 TaxID=1641855 RepID=UPI00131E3AA4|nr:hypothetical protein [Beijerinckia sp. L45]
MSIAEAIDRNRLAVARYIEAANQADDVWTSQRDPPQHVTEGDRAAYDVASSAAREALDALFAIVPATAVEIRQLLTYVQSVDRDGSGLRAAVASVLASPVLSA